MQRLTLGLLIFASTAQSHEHVGPPPRWCILPHVHYHTLGTKVEVDRNSIHKVTTNYRHGNFRYTVGKEQKDTLEQQVTVDCKTRETLSVDNTRRASQAYELSLCDDM